MNASREYKARLIWDELVRCAQTRPKATLYYQDIASLIGGIAYGVGHFLDPIKQFCEIQSLPPLTILVINKSFERPGRGLQMEDFNLNEINVLKDNVYDFPWNNLVNPFAEFDADESIDGLIKDYLNSSKEIKDISKYVKQRGVSQLLFRKILLKTYKGECAFCGGCLENYLEAAHIKSWEKSSSEERILPSNGLLLCANHHKLFDADILIVNENLKIELNEGKVRSKKQLQFAKSEISGLDRLRLPSNKNYWPDIDFIRERQKSATR
ncbi:HNH endonuclease [Pokkaliibacter sp. CJK22405]|uniref:HNH endonuclease n=1 Tax=Pokkaliibacter sp. CJK22405 TaxID=3384615 RepID=UPI003985469B